MITADRKLIQPLSALIALGLLLGGCVSILMPFVSVLLWAAIFVFSSRHVYWKLNSWLGGRPWLSASLLVALIIAVLVVPLFCAVLSFGQIAGDYALQLKAQLQQGVPQLPDWLVHAPYVGSRIDAWWQQLAAGDPEVREQLKNAALWLMKGLVTMAEIAGKGLGTLLMSCVVALFFYAGLPTATRWIQKSVHSLSGSRAEQLLTIAGGTVQGVVFGILGTAVAQGFLVGFALLVSGIPSAAGLTFLAIILSLVPVGAILIWGPAALWLYQHGETGWAWFMVIWCVGIVGLADNIIKPLLIGQNSNLPFLLIILGVLGGALRFGAIGAFLGPTLLALGYALLKEWLSEFDHASEQAGS